MTLIRKLIRAEIRALGDDEVEVIMSTAALARDGHVLEPTGCRLENYRANPIVLWGHDPDYPVGNAEDVQVDSTSLRCRIRFAQLGISPKADEVRGLTKTGVVRCVSVSFDPIDGQPLDPRKPRGGQRFTDWELLELSLVSVPSDVGAVVTNRSHGDEPMAEETVVEPAPVNRQRAARQRTRKPNFSRGLYQVSQMCYLFEELGWQLDMATIEAAVEGDGSKVPAMLAAVFADLGDAILAMTEEEIAEALSARDIEVEAEAEIDVLLIEEDRQHIAEASSPAVREFRRGMALAKLRAGKSLSAETVRCLRDARSIHDEAMDMHRSAMRKHRDAASAIDDLMDRAGVSEAVTGDDPAEPTEETDSQDDGQRAADPVIPPEPGATEPPQTRDYSKSARQAELASLQSAD